MKEFSKVRNESIHFFTPPTNFFKKRSSGMKIFLESNLPGNPILAEKKTSMCPQTADMWPEISATSEFGPKWVQNLPKIFNIC